MLNTLSKDLYKDGVVAVNRYIEMALVFFNTMVALMLLTAPWYIVEQNSVDVFPPGSDCTTVLGTAISPFVSEFCDGSSLGSLADGGSVWKSLHVFCWVYFVLALLASAIIGYEVVKHGVREWNDANTVGFAVQVGLVIVQSLILVNSDSAVKPHHTDDSTARILTLTAVALSSARCVMLGMFMYVTYKYNKRGHFGTGVYA
jgi:cytochrome bd-type quinol oxidase subunit 1